MRKGMVLLLGLTLLFSWSFRSPRGSPREAGQLAAVSALGAPSDEGRAFGTIDREGGTVALGSCSIIVSAGAVESPEKIGIIRLQTLPGPLPEGVVACTPPVSLVKSTGAGFKVPVVVTLPCVTDLAEDEEPVACFWDAARGRYRCATTIGVDRAAHSLTFETAHFTEFVGVTSPPRTSTSPDDLSRYEADTEFRPERDGFQFWNGDRVGAGEFGWCVGMSLMEVWYFDTKSPADPPLTELLRSANRGPTDLVGREMCKTVQDRARFNPTAAAAFDRSGRGGDRATILRALTAMKASLQPQVLGLRSGDSRHHAVVLYRFQDSRFFVHDSNHPTETETFVLDPTKGLIQYSAPSDSYVHVEATVTPASCGSDLDLRGVFQRAVADHGESINLARLALDTSGTLHFDQAIKGHVDGAGRDKTADRWLLEWLRGHDSQLRVFVHGTEWSLVKTVPIDRAGRFELTLSPLETRIVGDGTKELSLALEAASEDDRGFRFFSAQVFQQHVSPDTASSESTDGSLIRRLSEGVPGK